MRNNFLKKNKSVPLLLFLDSFKPISFWDVKPSGRESKLPV